MKCETSSVREASKEGSEDSSSTGSHGGKLCNEGSIKQCKEEFERKLN